MRDALEPRLADAPPPAISERQLACCLAALVPQDELARLTGAVGGDRHYLLALLLARLAMHRDRAAMGLTAAADPELAIILRRYAQAVRELISLRLSLLEEQPRR